MVKAFRTLPSVLELVISLGLQACFLDPRILEPTPWKIALPADRGWYAAA